MKDTEAAEIVTLLKAATNAHRLDDNTVLFWEEMLRPLRADYATEAALAGVKTWVRFPSWADFKQGYDLMRRLAEPDTHYRTAVKDPRGMPEWAHVWKWARTHNDDWRTLPQQEGHGDPFNAMTVDDYETLRAEWEAAGSPRLSPLEGILA